MIDSKLLGVVKKLNREKERINSAEKIWSLNRGFIDSESNQKSGIDFYDDSAGKMFRLSASDVRRLAEKGISEFCESAEKAAAKHVKALNQMITAAKQETVSNLVEIVSDEEAGQVRQTVGEYLYQELGPEIIDELIVILNGTNEYLKFHAVNVLSNIDSPRIMAPIIGALDDEDADVRRIASISLGRLGKEEAIEPLKELFSKETHSLTKEATTLALKKMGVSMPVLEVSVPAVEKQPIPMPRKMWWQFWKS